MSALDTEAIAGIVVGSFVLLGLGYGLSKNTKQYKHADKDEDENENENADENADEDEDKVSYRKSATLDNIENQYPDNDPIYKGVNSKNKLRFGEDQVRTIPARGSERGSGKMKNKSKRKSKKSSKRGKNNKSKKRG